MKTLKYNHGQLKRNEGNYVDNILKKGKICARVKKGLKTQ